MASEREARIEKWKAMTERTSRSGGYGSLDEVVEEGLALMRTAPSAAPDYPAELATLKQLIESAHDGQTSSGEPTTHAAALREIIANAKLANAPSAAPASAGRAGAVLGNDEAENQVSDVLNEMKSMPVNMTDDKVFLRLLRERGYGIAALRAEPSPEPQRAGAGLVEAVTELIDWLKRVFDGPAHRSAHINNQLGRQSIEPVIHALAAEQAREPVRPDSDRIRDLKSRVEIEKQRAERAEAEIAQMRKDNGNLHAVLRDDLEVERDLRNRTEKAESAFAALREHVEALVKRAKAIQRGSAHPHIERTHLVDDLAALPTEPDGAKADAGGVAVLRRLQADLASSEMTARANGRECRDNSFGKVACDASADAFGTALAMVVSLLAEAESQPDDEDPNRDGPARPMPTETFSEDEPEREGDDVLRIGAPDSAKREALRRGLLPFLCCQGNDPDCYGPSGCLLRALEGR